MHFVPRGRALLALCSLSFVLLGCNNAGSSTDSNQANRASRLDRAARRNADPTKPVSLEVFAPGDGDHAGIDGVSWFLDLDLDFPGDIKSTGFVAPQLTGPGVHANAAPFPGAAAPGKDDRFGGLVVLFSTTIAGAKSCQNVAGLMNITGVTDVAVDGTEIWDTWIIAAPGFGRRTASTLYVAEIADLNHDGIYNDAPDVVPDANNDGKCDASDLEALGTSSNLERVDFFIR
ncbi:MAG: hypothetical protein ABJD11_16335 [Gemmatimonadota bacterium]